MGTANVTIAGAIWPMSLLFGGEPPGRRRHGVMSTAAAASSGTHGGPMRASLAAAIPGPYRAALA